MSPGWQSSTRQIASRVPEQRRAKVLGCEDPGAALVARLESPWERLVGGCVLGGIGAYARECLQRAGADPEEQTDARRLGRSDRVSWGEWVRQAETLLGRRWPRMIGAHGDWGRDGLHYVATRYGGYRLRELLTQIEGLKYQAAAQGVRRFQQRLAADPARQRFVARLRHWLSARQPGWREG
jgi:hypothetical protein